MITLNNTYICLVILLILILYLTISFFLQEVPYKKDKVVDFLSNNLSNKLSKNGG